MSNNPFQPAIRSSQKARILITGPQGSGKSYTALQFAAAFGSRVAVIDTEHDRMRLYADSFTARNGTPFDHIALSDHSPRRYVDLINAAEANGYDVVVIDSLSHAWKATLQAVDAVTNRAGKQDSREGWKIHRPAHQALFDKIVQCGIHVIATARSKVEYDWENGKKASKGYQPIQDDEMPYEFDFVLDMTHNHQGVVTKVRGCEQMADRTVDHPTGSFIAEFRDWLASGAEPTPPVWKSRYSEAVALAGGVAELTDVLQGLPLERLGDDLVWERLLAALAQRQAGVQATTPAQDTPADALPIDDATPKVISEAQRRHFFAVANERGVPEDEQKRIVKDICDVTSRSDIPVDRFQDVLDALAAWEPTELGDVPQSIGERAAQQAARFAAAEETGEAS